MVCVDQNGLILIDEVEAAEDNKKLNIALTYMEEAYELVSQIAGVNSAFRGDTADAIGFSCAELLEQINQQKNKIEEEIKYVNEVVEKYKNIDANMKNQIDSTF